nr:ATP-binding protein [Sphingomonas panni]
MQDTHARRRASFFVGPPGIGKSTAINAFAAANPGKVMVEKINKRGVTGRQALQTLLLALRQLSDREGNHVSNATGEVQRQIAVEIERLSGGYRRDDHPELFPKLTIVLDEAQRLTNNAIDALRDWNEPHYFCAGTFPIGMIFVGNNELSLEAGKGGTSILDEGMQDRLLYRKRLTYNDVERADIERFCRVEGIDDDGAVGAIATAFAQQNAQRSFRRLSDFIVTVQRQAGADPVTRDTVRSALALL